MDYSFKNIVFQPVNKFEAFSVNPKVHYRAHKSPSLFTFLGAMNPVPLILVLPILLTILLSSRLRFSKLSLLLMSLQQIPACDSPLTHTCHQHRSSLSAWFANENDIWVGVQIVDLFVVQLHPFCSYPSLPYPDIFLVLELLLTMFVSHCVGPGFTPI